MKVRFEAKVTRGFSLSPRRFHNSLSPASRLALDLFRKEKSRKTFGTRVIDDIIKIENTRKKIKKDEPAKYKKQQKTFDEYFAESIKNKSIPKDTPPYLKKALKRALLEQGFKCPYISYIFKLSLYFPI